jgi:hypothetical protein
MFRPLISFWANLWPNSVGLVSPSAHWKDPYKGTVVYGRHKPLNLWELNTGGLRNTKNGRKRSYILGVS